MERVILKVSILFILCGLIVVTFHKAIFDITLPFITNYLSSDQKITSPLVLERGIIFSGFLLIIIGFLLSKIKKIPQLKILHNTIWSSEVKGILFNDSFNATKLSFSRNKMIFYSSIALCIPIMILYALGFMKNNNLSFLFMEDGFFESVTAVLFLVSALILLRVYINSKKQNCKSFSINSNYFLSLAVIFIVIGMEEISWGQRIFGWGTPGNLSQINYQGETNFHNILNPFFVAGYMFTTVLMFVVTLMAGIGNSNPKKNFDGLIFPHPSLLPVMFFMMLAALLKQLELVEELAAIFVFLYATRLNRVVSRTEENSVKALAKGKLKVIRVIGLLSNMHK